MVGGRWWRRVGGRVDVRWVVEGGARWWVAEWVTARRAPCVLLVPSSKTGLALISRGNKMTWCGDGFAFDGEM